MSTRLLLIGHGRMGRLVEQHAVAHGCEIAGIVTSDSETRLSDAEWGRVDVAVDFSHGAGVLRHVDRLAARDINVVIGTTGWDADRAAVQAVARGIGVLAAANFSIGVHILRVAVETVAAKVAALPDIGAFIHEAHHAAKKDAPSGTALLLKAAVERAGYTRPIDVSSTRAGSIPGRHTVGFDAPSEALTLTHDVRDRAVFAHGALAAAKWLKGRRGWFTIADMFSSETAEGTSL
jgi:4-hydroxy-tetrahydrodipicolinate reductase